MALFEFDYEGFMERVDSLFNDLFSPYVDWYGDQENIYDYL